MKKRNKSSALLGVCLTLLGFTIAGYARDATAKIEPRKQAEQMYNLLKDRCSIKNYTWDHLAEDFTVTFTLLDGSVLTYNARGCLIRRQAPNGLETHYEKGFPVKKISPPGEVISQTEYVRSSQEKIKCAVTRQKGFLTASFYTEDGDIQHETIHTPAGRLYRYNFTWADDRRTYNYYETRAWDGKTSYFCVSANTGLIREQWRVTTDLRQVWEEQHRVFTKLLIRRFEDDYSDRSQFKKDEHGQIRGDVLLKNIQPNKMLPLDVFDKYMQKGNLQFEAGWKYIDCSEVVIFLPLVEFVEQKRVIAQKVKVKKTQVYVWVKKRRKWVQYPYDSRKEKIIPGNRRGDARLEARFPKTDWKVIPEKMGKMKLNVRLQIPPELLEQQRLHLSQQQYADPDFYDLYALMPSAQEKSSEPTPAVRAGRVVTRFAGQELKTFKLELIQQIKNQLQNSPQLNQRDSRQQTQAQVILRALRPEQVLFVKELKSQLKQLRCIEHPAFAEIRYRELEIFLPKVQKQKVFKIINRVKENRGLVKIWKEDADHPAGGYWTTYTLRPFRDKLCQRGGHLIIQVDESRFEWILSSERQSLRVSGSVFLAKGSGKKIIPARATTTGIAAATEDKLTALESLVPLSGPAGQNKLPKVLQAAIPDIRLGIGLQCWLLTKTAGWLGRGRSGVRVLQSATPARGGEVKVLEKLDWWGHVNGYQRVFLQNQKERLLETYNQEKQLTSMRDLLGSTYQVTYLADNKIEVVRTQGGQQQVLRFEQGQLKTVLLSAGNQLEYNSNEKMHQVNLLTEKGEVVFEKLYLTSGKQVGMKFAQGEKIAYHYQKNKLIQILLMNKEGQTARLLVNKKGRIVKQSGNGKIIYFAKKQLDFILPDIFTPVTIQFGLK
ncbi:hypothetical protein KAR34_00155 [bacterium]|nr:hypothetical protein [bacterium]